MKHIKQFREQTDLFVADVVDPCLRDDRDMMSIPFFSLEKRKRLEQLQSRGTHFYEAREIIAQEMGHFRGDITQAYLR